MSATRGIVVVMDIDRNSNQGTTTTAAGGEVRPLARRAAATALAVTMLAGASAPAALASDRGAERPDLQARTQAFADAGFAGVQLRVHDAQGRWTGSAGARTLGAPQAPSTEGRFWVGSVSKTFTATVVLQLVADGRIGLDDPVADHLPDLGLESGVTVRRILDHTSGLQSYTGVYDEDLDLVEGIPATGEAWVEDRFRSYTPEELVQFALSHGPRFEPGTAWEYSNTNYTLAVLLVEAVTGRSYADELDRRILRPLGLKDTSVPGDRARIPGQHAHGYVRYLDGDGTWRVADVSRQNLSMLAGAGDMVSSTRDLEVFVSALLGGDLLPASLLGQMRTVTPHSAGIYPYGLGLTVQTLSCGVTVYQHNGSTPDSGYAAIMFSSADGRRTVTGSVTRGDDPDIDLGVEFQAALTPVVESVFCD